MQVTANAPIGQELTLASAVAQGRSTKTVSKEVFGITRKPDSFQKTLNQLTAQDQTYSPEYLKKMHMAKMQSASQATDNASLTVASDAAGEPTKKTVQFTQSDIDTLLKLFGSSQGDGDYMSRFDLDNNGTIDLNDLNAMLSQIAQSQQPVEPESPTEEPPAQYTQEDLDLLHAAFGAQVGDENYSDALDLDGDGIIGLDDLNLMLTNLSQSPEAQNPTPSTVDQLIAAFGTSQGDDAFVAELDLNGDGTLNLDDLNALLSTL